MDASPWLVVWDLDRTLGAFESLATMATDEAVRIYARPSIDEALERLSAQGFEHTVLTVATPDYARVALRGAGLWEHFAEVAGRGERHKGDAEGVAERFGIDAEQRPAKMIFVGDHPLIDPPTDPRVVFHLELHALERSALLVERLVLHLRERGEGSLRAGFDRLLGPAVQSDTSARPAVQAVRRDVAGVGRLLLFPEQDDAPKVAFDDPVDDPAEPIELHIRPTDLR